ncbi:MAG: hypothetical protein MMC33_010053 [Icmadophila ericetorum]|nr:hypothetical protein [Icmadophila ericetorum]
MFPGNSDSGPPQQRMATSLGDSAGLPERRDGITEDNAVSPPKDRGTGSRHRIRRFAPQLEESVHKRHGAQKPIQRAPVAPSPPRIIPVPALIKNPVPNSRTGRFTPQLLETTRRSRKSGDQNPALLPTDKTDRSPGDQDDSPQSPRSLRMNSLLLPHENMVAQISLRPPDALDSHFSSSKLSKGAPRRQSSFRVPDLAPILSSQTDSEDSNDSNCPSLSTSPSTASNEPDLHKSTGRARESCDDRFSGYLLALAAQAAEKQLRDQAMAAYPNENWHEPVDHFAVDRESDASDEESGSNSLTPNRRVDIHTLSQPSSTDSNTTDVKKRQERPDKFVKQLEGAKRTDLNRQHSSKNLLYGQAESEDAADTIRGKAAGLEHMRHAASPPMLGQDLRFSLCNSPQNTRLEVTQRPVEHKPHGTATPSKRSGLWTPVGFTSRSGSSEGLWHGVCTATDNTAESNTRLLQTGLMTPRGELDDPLIKQVTILEDGLPSSRTNSSGESKMSGLYDVLSLEKNIEDEFNDGFVTQIYNYLSLGYPSLARKFDHELSKISRIPMEEMRRDDEQQDTKGYVGAPEGCGSDTAAVKDGHCVRWMALRLYIKEWARQQPRMIERDGGGNNEWGDRARKGSWAI